MFPVVLNHYINYEIYGTLEQGEDGTSEKIKHVMPYQHRNHIFKDKYFKCAPKTGGAKPGGGNFCLESKTLQIHFLK